MINSELDWKIIKLDGYPENNGNGVSDLCIVFDSHKDCFITRYVFEDDEDDKHVNYWQDIADHLQHYPKIWAYLPCPSEEIYAKVCETYNKKSTN